MPKLLNMQVLCIQFMDSHFQIKNFYQLESWLLQIYIVYLLNCQQDLLESWQSQMQTWLKTHS